MYYVRCVPASLPAGSYFTYYLRYSTVGTVLGIFTRKGRRGVKRHKPRSGIGAGWALIGPLALAWAYLVGSSACTSGTRVEHLELPPSPIKGSFTEDLTLVSLPLFSQSDTIYS
ncbi:hypothetical protein F4782DRAFT_241576 [Xylaria castorea]|nr:hypothetical protein F4782DRAFT_241576 [Xylaria castorea]